MLERELDPKALFPADTLGSLCGRVYAHLRARYLLLAVPVQIWYKISFSEVLDPSAALCLQAVCVTCSRCS